MKINVYIDVSNLYLCLNLKYKAKLNYEKYLDYIKGFGTINQVKAYGAQVQNEARSFIRHLKRLGIEPIYKRPQSYSNSGIIKTKADHDVLITVDVIRDYKNYDIFILGSADGDFVDLVKYIKEYDKKVYIVACDISHKLKKFADEYIEIPKNFLEGS